MPMGYMAEDNEENALQINKYCHNYRLTGYRSGSIESEGLNSACTHTVSTPRTERI